MTIDVFNVCNLIMYLINVCIYVCLSVNKRYYDNELSFVSILFYLNLNH